MDYIYSGLYSNIRTYVYNREEKDHLNKKERMDIKFEMKKCII